MGKHSGRPAGRTGSTYVGVRNPAPRARLGRLAARGPSTTGFARGTRAARGPEQQFADPWIGNGLATENDDGDDYFVDFRTGLTDLRPPRVVIRLNRFD